MIKPIKTVLCTALILAAALTGCGVEPTENLSGNTQEYIDESSSETNMATLMNVEIEKPEVDPEADPELTVYPTGTIAATDFGLKLLKESMKEGENALISPLSVLCALGMTANGAEGDTLKQMEMLFGISRQQMNEYLYGYINALPQGEKYKLTPANSIWIKDMEGLKIQEDFLQANADWHNAEIYKAPFDNSTVEEINNWVNENTDGMIPTILNNIPRDAVMYLINALAFDAEWQNIYESTQIRDGIFTASDGTKQDVEMMYSDEHQYLEDDGAVGFIKYYVDEKYAFAALLPDEGTSLEDYTASLTAERLSELLANPQKITVKTAIPKFRCEYSVELNDILHHMGMTHAFDREAADFTSMGSCTEGPLYISRILHKTYISVDERGTKAGAVTAVEMLRATALAPEEVKTVYLDRPFLYMLIDCEENLPVFIGTLEWVEQ